MSKGPYDQWHYWAWRHRIDDERDTRDFGYDGFVANHIRSKGYGGWIDDNLYNIEPCDDDVTHGFGSDFFESAYELLFERGDLWDNFKIG